MTKFMSFFTLNCYLYFMRLLNSYIKKVIVAFLITASFQAYAVVTPITNSDGKLIRVENIEVYPNNFFDVTFLDGTFSEVYPGYVFPTYLDEANEALAFSNALVSQVFEAVNIGTPPVALDYAPELTFGCADSRYCYSTITYDFINGDGYTYTTRNRDIAIFGTNQAYPVAQPALSFDTADSDIYNHAVFTPSIASAVPEPSEYTMILIGLALLSLRRCKYS